MWTVGQSTQKTIFHSVIEGEKKRMSNGHVCVWLNILYT